MKGRASVTEETGEAGAEPLLQREQDEQNRGSRKNGAHVTKAAEEVEPK